MIAENFSLTHFDGLSLPCTLRLPRQKSSSRLVIIAPGFLGFKDWGFFPFLADRLCRAGFVALAFSHALCGVQDNPLEITDAQAFSKNTTSQELKDWDLVLDSVLLSRLPRLEKTRLHGFGIVGHSRGGSYGILMASRVPQIQSVVAWGAIQTFQRYDAETQRQWRASGAWEVTQDRSGRKLSLALEALDALERNRDRLDVLRAIRSVNIPVLFVHGRDDKRVKLAEAQALWKCANPYLSRLHVIESAGHTFRTQHPLDKPSQSLLEAVEETVRWFQRTLPMAR
ncbi:MAG TPA: alpha/beta fold hydrolase [Terriglobia bacterium]|nr:alpha/beta fold hydrolase [Terriglobia bacterium]